MARDFAEHSWKDLSVFLDGNPLTTLQDFSYSTEQDFEEWDGASVEPRVLLPLNKRYKLSITVSQREYSALINASRAIIARQRGGVEAPDFRGDLLQLKNLIIVGTFLNPRSVGSLLRLHTVKATGVQFLRSGIDLVQGEKVILYTLPAKALDISE